MTETRDPAEAAAFSLYAATHPNPFGDTEDKYARLLIPACYRHKGGAAGLWPEILAREFRGAEKGNPPATCVC